MGRIYWWNTFRQLASFTLGIKINLMTAGMLSIWFSIHSHARRRGKKYTWNSEIIQICALKFWNRCKGFLFHLLSLKPLILVAMCYITYEELVLWRSRKEECFFLNNKHPCGTQNILPSFSALSLLPTQHTWWQKQTDSTGPREVLYFLPSYESPI